MTTTMQTFSKLPSTIYIDLINKELTQTIRATVKSLYAETFALAAQKAGYTPIEFASWLVQVDGL